MEANQQNTETEHRDLSTGDPIEVVTYQEPDGTLVIIARTRARVTRIVTAAFLSDVRYPEEIVREMSVRAAVELRDKLLAMLPKQKF